MYEKDLQAQTYVLIVIAAQYSLTDPMQLLKERPEVFNKVCQEWRATHPLEA